MAFSAKALDLAKPDFRFTHSRKDWKSMVKSCAGSSFEYTVTGWKEANASYVSDSVTISVNVSDECSLQCSDDLCDSPYFGAAPNCRAERNVYKHIVAYHSPLLCCVETIKTAPEPKKKKQALLLGSQTRLSVSHCLIDGISTESVAASGGAVLEHGSDIAIGAKRKEGSFGFGFTQTVVKTKEQKRKEREERVHSCEIEGTSRVSNAVSPTASLVSQATTDSEIIGISDGDGRENNGTCTTVDIESSTLHEEEDKATNATEEHNVVVVDPGSSPPSIGGVAPKIHDCVDASNINELYPNPPYWAHCLGTKHAPHHVKNGNSDPIIHCRGADLRLREPAVYNFPIHISFVVPRARGSFYFDTQDEVVRSWRCGRFEWKSDLDNDDNPHNYRCSLCRELSNDDTLQKIVDRANDDSLYQTHIKSEYLTFSQLQQRSLYHSTRGKDILMDSWSCKKNVTLLMKHRDESKALIVAIADKKVARGQQLLAQCLKRGSSVNFMLETYNKAADAKFHPKQYDQDDLDEDYLAWLMGGARLVYAQNHSDRTGGASISTIRRKSTVPRRYITMAAEIELNTIIRNFERFVVESQGSEIDSSVKCLWNMMIDDIKGEKRVRIDESDGKVRGLCYHAVTNNISLDICCEDDCNFLRTALDEGKVHYAQEITNVAIAPIREEMYEPKVIATSAGCRVDDPLERLERLLTMSISVYVNHKDGQKKRGLLSTVQPDGASAFVKIGQKLFFAEKMKEDHPLHASLSKLPLFCLWTGTGDRSRITMGCEMKHSFKRVREKIKSNTGCTFVTFEFTGSLLRDLLLTTGVKGAEVDAMFATGYADAMNVPYMVKLFRALADLKDKSPHDFDKWEGTVQWCIKDIQLMSRFAELIATIVADKRPSLGQQLENISELMHMAFVIYRRNGTKWLAAQTYSNLQRLCRSIYWSLANAIVEGVEEYFHYQDSGDKLELLYCIVRCLLGGASGNGSGVDVLQFGERVGGAMAVDSIFAQKPHLKKASRHLATTSAAGSDDHQNPRSFLSTPDGKQDRSRVEVAPINLLNRYMRGRSRAEQSLTAAGYKAEELDWDRIAQLPDVDLLRPNGRFVGVGSEGEEDGVQRDTCNTAVTDDDTVSADVPDSVLIEEALGAVPDDASLKPARMKQFKLGNGKSVSSAQCLRLAFAEKRQTATETSRVARQMDIAKSGTAVHQDVRSSFISEKQFVIRAGEDPMVTLISTDHGVSLVLVMPERFVVKLGKETTVLSSISEDNFKGDLVVRGAAIIPVVTKDNIIWAVSNGTRHKFEFFAKDASLVNPDIICDGTNSSSSDGVGNSGTKHLQYKASRRSLESVLHILYLKHESNEQSLRSVLPDLKDIRGIPYRSSGKIVFLAQGSNDKRTVSSQAKSASARSNNKMVQCKVPGCKERFQAAYFPQHAAYHIRHDKLLEKKVGTPVARLCGLCAAFPAVQYSADPDNIEGCAFWLEKPKGARVWKLRSRCKVIGEIPYSLAVESKSSRARPSTNVPMRCLKCPTDPLPMTVWKHGMSEHYHRLHAGTEMSEEMKNDLLVTDVEMKGLLKYRKAQQTRTKKGTRKAKASKASRDVAVDDSSDVEVMEEDCGEADGESADNRLETEEASGEACEADKGISGKFSGDSDDNTQSDGEEPNNKRRKLGSGSTGVESTYEGVEPHAV